MLIFDSKKCIRCGKCVEDCNRRRIILTDDGPALRTDTCMECGHCVAICPVEAVHLSGDGYDAAEIELTADLPHSDPKTVLSEIKAHRSIRKYTAEPVGREDLHLLHLAATYTSRAKNNNDARMIFVQNEIDTLRFLAYEHLDHILLKDPSLNEAEKNILERISFNYHKDPTHDYLLRNAPAVIFFTSPWALDPGLLAKDIENMAFALGLGVMYDGYLCRIADTSSKIKEFLGVPNEHIGACMLIGHPDVEYLRTPPRKPVPLILR